PPAPSETYTLSLHDALPISRDARTGGRRMNELHAAAAGFVDAYHAHQDLVRQNQAWTKRIGLIANDSGEAVTLTIESGRVIEVVDRKSTCLNSSHVKISYAV